LLLEWKLCFEVRLSRGGKIHLPPESGHVKCRQGKVFHGANFEALNSDWQFLSGPGRSFKNQLHDQVVTFREAAAY
jgi:hypothetical protein